ncbi:MAG: hypothetical protein II561_01735 [Thermoguttaceae bacterium]|nr:hypothetical protein [Thermoguttaceae bacterium]MBQ2555247.1 hypothetical protein [Thermoguttaceae bacterium]
MKKVITFSLIALLTSPVFVGCKSGTSCFSRTGSRIPTSAITSNYDDGSSLAAANSPRIVNAASSGEVVMMNTTSASQICAPCAPTQCNPCSPCTPCGSATGTSASGYPAGSYASAGL